MGRRNGPRTGRRRRGGRVKRWVWWAVGGGAVAVGVGVYLVTRPKAAAAAAVAPLPTPAPAPATPQYVMPGTTYSVQMTSDQTIGLTVGTTVLAILPPPPGGALGWTPLVENHDGQAGYNAPVAGQTPNTFVITAQGPGVSVVRFAPYDQFGPMGAVYSLTITITQAAGYVTTQTVNNGGVVSIAVGQSVYLQYAAAGPGRWVIDAGGGLLPDSSKYVSVDGSKVTGLSPGRALLHWVNPDGSTAADATVNVS